MQAVDDIFSPDLFSQFSRTLEFKCFRRAGDLRTYLYLALFLRPCIFLSCSYPTRSVRDAEKETIFHPLTVILDVVPWTINAKSGCHRKNKNGAGHWRVVLASVFVEGTSVLGC
jgi:hypothetical protein